MKGMTLTIVDESRPVTGGVDTHADNHVAAALDSIGGLLGVREFPATPAGYAQLLGWLSSFGSVCLVGIEGTGSYGAGLARHVAAAGIRVVEVDRSDRQDRRRRGKSDPLDAVSAARAALSGRAGGASRGRDGQVVHDERHRRLLDSLLTDPAPARDQLAARLHQAWASLVAPFWVRLRALLDRDIEERSRTLAGHGLRRVLGELHPKIRWTSRGLSLADRSGRTVEVGERGFLLMPSAYLWPHAAAVVEAPWLPTIFTPPPASPGSGRHPQHQTARWNGCSAAPAPGFSPPWASRCPPPRWPR